MTIKLPIFPKTISKKSPSIFAVIQVTHNPSVNACLWNKACVRERCALEWHRKCVRDVGSFCSALLPSTAMAGLSVYLSVVSAVLLHSCAGWIRLKHRWGGRTTTSEHGRASLYSLTDARPEPGSRALSLPDASRPFVVWDTGTRPMEAAPAESPPPSPHLTAGRQKVITPWMFLDLEWMIKATAWKRKRLFLLW